MRRRLVLLAAAVSLLLATWWGIEWLAGVDRYRPLAERELERLSGLPVSIGELDLRLLPIPRVSALRVRVGEADFGAETGRVDLIPELAPLLRGQLRLRNVRVAALSLTLPEDDERIARVWQDLRERFAAEAPEPGIAAAPAVQIDRIRADEVRLVRGPAAKGLASGSLLVEGLSGDPSLEVSFRVVPWKLSVEGAVQLSGQEPARRIAGELRVRGLHTDALVALPDALRASAELDVEVEGNLDDRVLLQIDGELAADSPSGPAGPFTSRIALEAGPPQRLSYELEAHHLQARGALDRSELGAELRVDALSAAGAALAVLVAGLEGTPLRLDPSAAVLKAHDWQLDLPQQGAPQLRSGRIEIEGVTATWQERGFETPWSLAGRVEDGAFVVDALGSGPVALSGVLHPDAGWDRWQITAAGRAELGTALLEAFGEAGASLSGLQGELVLDDLRVALPADPDVPLQLRAQLRNGATQLQAAGLEDSLSGVELDLEAEGDGFQLTGRARSTLLGEVALSAARSGDATPVRGVLSLDARALAPKLPADALPIDLAVLLRAYGPTELGFEAAPADASGGNASLRIARKQAPTLEGSFSLPEAPAGAWLGDLTLEAEIPAAALAGAFPDAAELRGRGSLSVVRRLGEGRFRAKLDCAALGIRLGDWIDKREGEPLLVSVEGDAKSDAAWQARTLTLSTGRDPVRFVASGDGWEAGDVSLDLAQWTSLFPASFQLAGRLAGRVSAPPLVADLRLDGAELSLAPELPRLTLDGSLALHEERGSTPGLRVRGPQTDFVVEATSSGGAVSGRLRGDALSVETLQPWVEHFQRPSEPETPEGAGFSADFEVSLGALRAGGSEMRNLRTRLRFGDGGASLSGIELDTYEGKVSGEVSLAESRLRLSLDVREVTGRFLDHLFFAGEERGIRGKFGGLLDFEGPANAGLRPMLAGGTGSLAWSARQGSFGRLGLATRLITVLRTTEVLRLKLPSLRDDGLVFDRVDSVLRMQEGRLEVESFRLDAPVYALTATGGVDFVAESTSIPIEFDALHGVSAILEPIPVAGDALKIANVRLHASGSPYQMKIHIASLRDQVVGASMAVPNATVTRIRDALDLLKPRPGAAAHPDPDATATPTPDPGAQPPPDLEPPADAGGADGS